MKMRSSSVSRRNRGRNTNGRRNNGGVKQVFENSNTENKFKGSPLKVQEKYIALARDAKSSGDTIKAENFLQHAEHFHRVHLSTHSSSQHINNYSKEKEEQQKNVIIIKKEEAEKDIKSFSSDKLTKNDKSSETKPKN